LCFIKCMKIFWIFQWLLFFKKSICPRSFFTLWTTVASSMYQIFQYSNFCIFSTQSSHTFHVHAKKQQLFPSMNCLTGHFNGDATCV
jgi:hypothetical protein